MVLRDALQPFAVRAVTDDHAAQARVGGQRVEKQVVPLATVEGPDGEDEVVIAFGAVGKLLRRMRHHLRLQSRRALEPARDVARGREELARLAEGNAVEPLDGAPRGAVLDALVELPELGAVELVRL